jgi:hypothetical protein
VSACTLNDDREDVPRLYLGSVQADGDVDHLEVSWWYPAGNAGGFVLEQRINSEPFRDIQQFTGISQGTVVDLDPSIAGTVEFRLRATPIGTESAVVAVQRQLRTPDISVTLAGTAFQVRFDRPAGSGDRIELTRRTLAANGIAGAWVALATGLARTNTYADVDLSGWIDAARYEYRAIIYAGTQASQEATAVTEAAPYLGPVITYAAQEGPAVRITFEWHSAVAGKAVIYSRLHYELERRQLAVLDAPPPGTSLSYQIPIGYPLDSIGGVLECAVAASGSGVAESIGVRWAVVRPPNLQASIADLPPGLEMARASSGAFAVLADVPAGSNGSMRVLIPPGGGLSEGLAVPSGYHPRGIVLDGGGHPHAAFADTPDGNGAAPCAVIHVWHDGLGWRREEIGTFDVNGMVALASGADGGLHLSWSSSANEISVADQRGGSWVIEKLPSGLSSTSPLLLAGDENGAPHLIANGESQPLHLWRDGAGWHSEPTPPLAFGPPGTARRPLFLFAAAGRVTFVERGEEFAGAVRFLSVAIRTASGWAEPSGLGEDSYTEKSADPYRAAISPDGSRIAVGSTGTVYFFGGANLTSMHWESNLTPFAVGFTPAGKAWAVEYISDWLHGGAIPPQPGNAVLYEEF